MIDSFLDAAGRELESAVEFLPRLFFAILIFFVIYLFGRFISGLLLRILKRSKMPEAYHLFFGRLVSGIAVFTGIVVFLNLIGYSTLAASLVAGGGLTAVMLGFAFKNIGENFLAGFFLAFSRPFTTNDVIETGGILGRVKGIELRHTHIRTSDGCDVFVPSSQLFTQPLHNYTLDGLRRGSFTIGIDYADDAQEAMQRLKETVADTKGVLQSPQVTVQIKGLQPDYVELQVFFWINAKDQEQSLARVRSTAMDTSRRELLENGFTVSSDVTTAVKLDPVDVRLGKGKQH